MRTILLCLGLMAAIIAVALCVMSFVAGDGRFMKLGIIYLLASGAVLAAFGALVRIRQIKRREFHGD